MLTNVNPIIFPNAEKRLDLDTLYDKYYWYYRGDADWYELFLLNNVLTRHDKKATLVVSFLPGARMDRIEDDKTAFNLEVSTQLLRQLNSFDNIIINDPHNVTDLYEGFTTKEFALFDYLYPTLDKDNVVFVLPDKGAYKRFKSHNLPNVLVCDKVRDFKTGRLQSLEIQPHQLELNKQTKYIIIDDICSYGGTFVLVAEALKKAFNAQHIELCVSHLEKVAENEKLATHISKVITSNSISNPSDFYELNVEMHDVTEFL